MKGLLGKSEPLEMLKKMFAILLRSENEPK